MRLSLCWKALSRLSALPSLSRPAPYPALSRLPLHCSLIPSLHTFFILPPSLLLPAGLGSFLPVQVCFFLSTILSMSTYIIHTLVLFIYMFVVHSTARTGGKNLKFQTYSVHVAVDVESLSVFFGLTGNSWTVLSSSVTPPCPPLLAPLRPPKISPTLNAEV